MCPSSATSDYSIFSQTEWIGLVKELALSPREGEIIKLLFSGCTDKQIALHLDISVATIRTHLGRLFKKLEANGREELLLQVFEHFRRGCRQLDCPRNR
ncbi:MAG: helix-turn-helix transcriptional regulator [Phycisphaerae bacterium]|jgi:DNA-binding CsgD family transcriptional regulator